VGGRGAVVHGAGSVNDAITQTRGFLTTMIDETQRARKEGGTVRDAFKAVHKALAPKFGKWPIFEHCLPFDVQRLWDELDGTDWPLIWTAERDREVWDRLQS
jgi:hypothetical protein